MLTEWSLGQVIIASLHQRIEDLNSKLGTHMSHGRDSAVEDKGREAASAQREALELERFVRQLQDVVKAKQAVGGKILACACLACTCEASALSSSMTSDEGLYSMLRKSIHTANRRA